MQIYPNSIGVKNADGSIALAPEVCALTGQPIGDDHHTSIPLDETHFVWVVSQQARHFTDEDRAELIASYTAASPKSLKSLKSNKAASTAENAAEEKN